MGAHEQNPDESPSRASDRRWAVVRILLGSLQIFGASLGVILLIETGVTRVTLLVVALTGVCTTVSVLLFGSMRPRR